MTLVFYKSLIVYFLSDKEAKKQTTVHHLCILQANRSGYTYTQEDMYGDSVSQSVKGTPLLEYHTPKQGAHGPHSQSTLISFKYVLRVSLHLPMQMEMHLSSFFLLEGRRISYFRMVLFFPIKMGGKVKEFLFSHKHISLSHPSSTLDSSCRPADQRS